MSCPNMCPVCKQARTFCRLANRNPPFTPRLQRDELGLLPIRTAAAQLGTSLPDDLQLHKQRRRQPQAGEPPLPPLASRSQPQHQEASSQRRRPRSWSGSPPVADGALAQHVEQYGKSPDSDDCAELTGRHLMQIVHPECPASPSTAGTPTPGKGGQQQQQDEQQQPQQAGAAAPASPRLREHRHTTEHAEEAYTLPEHAQAAALLGQPVYDRSLNVGPVVVGGGSGLPHPSPFSASPPQHVHLSSLFQAQQQQQPRQQGQEQQQQQEQPGVSSLLAGGRCTSLPLAVPASPRGAGAAAALADGLAQLSGLGSPAGSVTGGALAASCAAHWLQDEEAAAEALRREVATHGRSVFASLPFSVRNAPLLRVIPKYCEWQELWGWACIAWVAGQQGRNSCVSTEASPVWSCSHPPALVVLHHRRRRQQATSGLAPATASYLHPPCTPLPSHVADGMVQPEDRRRVLRRHNRCLDAHPSAPVLVRIADGVAQHFDGRTLLELEDLARAYHRPCIMDIKASPYATKLVLPMLRVVGSRGHAMSGACWLAGLHATRSEGRERATARWCSVAGGVGWRSAGIPLGMQGTHCI